MTPAGAGVRLTERRWLLAWIGAASIGVANGVLREALNRAPRGRRLSDRTAHQLSTVSAVVLLTGYAAALNRRMPLPDAHSARRVGLAWAAGTLAFEFGFGRTAAGQSWKELLADYDVRHGRFWVAVPATMAIAPGATAGYRSAPRAVR